MLKKKPAEDRYAWNFKRKFIKKVILGNATMTDVDCAIIIANHHALSQHHFKGNRAKPNSEQLVNSMRRWQELKVNPSNNTNVWWWDALANKLNRINSQPDDKVNGVDLFASTRIEFCEAMSKVYDKPIIEKFVTYFDDQPVPTTIVGNKLKSIKPSYNIGGVPAFFQTDIPKIEIGRSVKEKILDQRTFYLRTRSPKDWKGFTKDKSYKIYNKCSESLDQMLEKGGFLKIFDKNKINRIVMLGGAGCNSKDMSILGKLARKKRFTVASPLTYLLFDISQWMLLPSLTELAECITDAEEKAWEDHFILKAGVGDFMNMKRLKEHFRENDDNILWGFTGGTLGNVKETDFFRSLNSVSTSGDLLLLSVSTLPEEKNDESTEGSKSSIAISSQSEDKEPKQPVTYTANRQTRAMLRAPLNDFFENKKIKQLLPESDAGRHIFTAEDVFTEEMIDEVTQSGLSDIIDSPTLELFCTLKRGTKNTKIVLHRHTQYEAERLVEFLRDDRNYYPDHSIHGKWDLVETAQSKNFQDFTQFLFQKV